jgi:hypothetical protein
MSQNIYNNSKIYKVEPIVVHEPHEIYIGSTTNKYLSDRLAKHKSSYKAYLNNINHYISIFDLFDKYGVENCKIFLIESYNCNDINELRTKEGAYIRTLNCINKFIPGRTEKEYREDNKYKMKQYYEDNKDKLLQQQKEYYESNRDKIKQYRENKKDKTKEYQKEYYESNKDKISEFHKTKITCSCGCEVVKHHLNRHMKTEKHKKLISSNNDI